MQKILFAGLMFLMTSTAFATGVATDKTLVVWVEINETKNWDGMVFTVLNEKRYEGIIVSGEDKLKWRVIGDSGRVGDADGAAGVGKEGSGEVARVGLE